jgi:hypothetical protein
VVLLVCGNVQTTTTRQVGAVDAVAVRGRRHQPGAQITAMIVSEHSSSLHVSRTLSIREPSSSRASQVPVHENRSDSCGLIEVDRGGCLTALPCS